MKTIIVILDGAADKIGKKKTPLEKANMPYINFLANYGQTGMMYPIKKEIAPESDQSMLSMLGFNPFKYYTGRGPLEAYGARIKFKNSVLNE